MSWLTQLLDYFHLTGVCSQIKLEQSASVAKRPGETVKMSCITSGFDMTKHYMHWIRQKPGRWIFHMWGSGSLTKNDALKNKFSGSRDTSAGTVTITGQSLQPEDTAVYYCVRCRTVMQTTVKPVQKLSRQQTDIGAIIM
uniref:Ig-like domain-containing protein n=1 Tax=Fundulus heteroclitus TaxID=8078 RepID=A0A3Q2R4G4_FUNHE